MGPKHVRRFHRFSVLVKRLLHLLVVLFGIRSPTCLLSAMRTFYLNGLKYCWPYNDLIAFTRFVGRPQRDTIFPLLATDIMSTKLRSTQTHLNLTAFYRHVLECRSSK
jgi:hypothetical protein